MSFIGRKISGKTILVTGGTGSFGSEIVRTLLRHEVREIRIMSRDEDLQHQMALNIADKRLKFIIGDVRDESRINDACSGVQIIFHAAALKQVPDCENHPLEAVKTNILGAANVKRAAMLNGVKDIVAISTDKAVKPINAMGMTKALQEKIFTSDITGSATSKFSVVRYGNVMGSRGSVIPLFRNRVAKGLPLFVTDFRMTRFLLSLGDAVQLVFKALLDAKGGEIFVLKKKACLVRELAEVIAEGKVDVIEGHIRAGEKLHETLVQEDEMRRATEEADYFIIHPTSRNRRSKGRGELFEYTSENAARLKKGEIESLLRAEKLI